MFDTEELVFNQSNGKGDFFFTLNMLDLKNWALDKTNKKWDFLLD